MISAAGLRTYLLGVYRATAVYMWGADCEIGTEELLKKKIEQFGASHYRELSKSGIEGRICADCSGLFTPVSGYNMTANDYYKQCVVKGAVKDMPLNKVCMLFRKQGNRVVHVAGYTGDGYLVEMFNGCERREFVESEWTYYGFPAWLEEQPGDTVFLTESETVYTTAANAKNGVKPCKNKYAPGEYYIYKTDEKTGAVNITKTKGKPGAWVML